ncbi:MAG: rhomboid family intramembrane serine protease [Gemmatimonadota bacterium]
MALRTTPYRPFDATFPQGVKWLLIACAGVFVVQTFAPAWFTALFGLQPAAVVHELWVWQPFTYMFLHGGLFHLLFNLLVLWMMGGEVERFWGRSEFLRYYVICGLGAAALAFVFAFDGLVIGASGAVFGVMVAFALMFPNRLIYIWFVVPVPAKVLVPVLFAIELLVVGGRDGVAHFAHVGGAVTGFLYLRLEARDRLGLEGVIERWRRRRLRVHPGGAGAARPALPAAPADPVREAEIDRILDKISRTGLQSLTPEESRVLEEASRRFRDRG